MNNKNNTSRPQHQNWQEFYNELAMVAHNALDTMPAAERIKVLGKYCFQCGKRGQEIEDFYICNKCWIERRK